MGKGRRGSEERQSGGVGLAVSAANMPSSCPHRSAGSARLSKSPVRIEMLRDLTRVSSASCPFVILPEASLAVQGSRSPPRDACLFLLRH